MTVSAPRNPRPLREFIAEAPLVPVALAATMGLMADRYLNLPIAVDVLILLAGLAGWFGGRHPPAMRWAACAAVAALAAMYHHGWLHFYSADDIGQFVTSEPQLVRLRGVLDDEPILVRRPRGDPLVSYLRPDPTRAMLEVREYQAEDGAWESASGRARLTVEGPLFDVHVGDEIEVFGWLEAPRGPLNPGGVDTAQRLRDRRVRAELFVRRNPAAIVPLADGWGTTPRGWRAKIRGWGRRIIDRELPADQAPIAAALLLGDTSAMNSAEWDRFVRTGVVHVLAISGQHLAVVAIALGLILARSPIPRRPRALIVVSVLVGYAFLTGFRPPVQRAAVIAVVGAGAVVLRRLPLPANNFALAWLIVLLLDPTEPFSLGCQLSFLSVAVLGWGVSRLTERTEPDELERLIDATRSPVVRALRGGLKLVGRLYLTALVVAVALMPMVAARHHVLPFAGPLIGPPVLVLSSIALISGFAMLLTAPLGLAAPFAFLTRWALDGCDGLAAWAEQWPGGHPYVPAPPEWWLWGWYLGLLTLLWGRSCWPRRGWFALGGAAWVLLALMLADIRASDELRVTFVAVGHGGCTVIETPDGRVLLYDAGAMGGPEIARRHIAPFLWSSGHRRIDELFLSHADLDHFNGTTELLELFPIGQVTLTPSFAHKDAPGVRRTLAVLRERQVPLRIVHAGQRLEAGAVELRVLHPPLRGPEGEENVRSLVLRIRHGEHSILLTGDLQSPGLEQVTRGPPGDVHVLMAPHHGSPSSNTAALARWAKPRLVVACDSKPRPPRPNDPYARLQVPVWVTGVDGAVMIRSRGRELIAQSYASGRQLQLGSSDWPCPE